jgi:hypothetical protein
MHVVPRDSLPQALAKVRGKRLLLQEQLVRANLDGPCRCLAPQQSQHVRK